MDTPLTYSPIGEWEAPGPREGSTPATHQCGASQRQSCDQTGGESRAWCALGPGHTGPHGPPTALGGLETDVAEGGRTLVPQPQEGSVLGPCVDELIAEVESLRKRVAELEVLVGGGLPEGWVTPYTSDPLMAECGDLDVEMDNESISISWLDGCDDHFGTTTRSCTVPTQLVREMLYRLAVLETAEGVNEPGPVSGP